MINIGDWIKKWSFLQPHKRALIFEDHPFTYQEVNLRTNQLCHLFLELGVQKGDRISVLLYNCHQYLEIFFALSKIGAILVPLNWRLAGPELEFIIRDSGSRILIFDPEFEEEVGSIRPNLNLSNGDYIVVGPPCSDWEIDYEKAVSNQPSHEPSINGSIGDEDPHILMYTSGTTGIPKGAVLSHRKTFFNVLNADIFNNLTSEDIIIVSRPMFHSGGLLVDAAPVLYKGGTLILKKRFRPHEILETVQKYRVTLLELPATVYQFILQQCDLSQYDLSSARRYLTGGERIPEAMLKEYFKKGIVISQIFGLTEASTITFLSPEKAAQKIGSVGFPVFYGEVRIVDKMRKDVSPGEVGEIIIRGPTLMSGYWNRPELTAETIRDGWLYTGDLARTDEEGYIYIVDREKDMYISGGENVYPAEIEKVLPTHPKIFDAGIVGVQDEKWGEVGKAFIVLKPGETMGSDEVFEFLKGKVAKYKIPKYVEFIEELPKTASGKIQKFVLKEWHKGRSTKFQAPNKKVIGSLGE
ncbi:MAG: AMP-dependent synthetase [Deltaproteobacteria bacterium CG_4_8_14_3_um_filter_45_9]|nr:MAG: AMP-dependent synthetase [Deltaproteobacteria bacterium CG03_land_8_20_14_0_80_45_14]PIX25529.1 MAG: AMP-dependent synthetase [Deltaproteobacteria bacterium CG_4_8_14_3_um_filter_45_9]